MIGNTGKLAGKTLFITGASRGIGKSIALKAAKDGANVVIAAKTIAPHPKLSGTIYTAAKEIEEAGGNALACPVDIRSEVDVKNAVDMAVKKFNGIDILVNNASAINLNGTESTDMKRFDLMNNINTRGTFLVSKYCIPVLKASKNPHILNLSPPLNMKPIWFKNHVAYTIAKYSMSMCTLGMAEELKDDGIACNALWPRTAIYTAAMDLLGGDDIGKSCRKPDIMGDAAYAMLCRDSKTFTGNFAIDEDILKEEGVIDFDSYAVDPSGQLMPDFFLDEFLESGYGKELKMSDSATAEANDEMSKLFKEMSSVLNAELVEKMRAVFSFELSGKNTGSYFLDLKEGTGSCGKGAPNKADTTFKMTSEDFVKMFTGKLKPTQAFMSGKMKISGDMSKAMKLEQMMGKLKSKL